MNFVRGGIVKICPVCERTPDGERIDTLKKRYVSYVNEKPARDWEYARKPCERCEEGSNADEKAPKRAYGGS